MVGQATLLRRWNGPPTPALDALIEAPLVHVRLLEDFLRQRRDKVGGDDATATHYLPTWKPRGFLTKAQRRDINGHVQHLAGRRDARIGWSVDSLVIACCDSFREFLNELKAGQPDRYAWFGGCVDVIGETPPSP